MLSFPHTPAAAALSFNLLCSTEVNDARKSVGAGLCELEIKQRTGTADACICLTHIRYQKMTLSLFYLVQVINIMFVVGQQE